MLERIYIDNYKCFANFEFQPGPISLLIGLNGTGKSALLDVLSRLSALGAGASVAEQFPPTTLTRWEMRTEQTFELDVSGKGGIFAYRLQLLHEPDRSRCRIAHEHLRLDSGLLYEFVDGEAHLYRDNHSAGPVFPFDWARSAIATIPPRHDNQKLTWFRDYLASLLVLSLDPRAVSAQTDAEATRPGKECSNFASWYRHVTQEQPGQQIDLFKQLKEAIPAFLTLRLAQSGERTRTLKAVFASQSTEAGAEPRPVELGFDELSDGQRALVVLYTLLEFAIEHGKTLCIDEPDNFMALAEIQPWLTALYDRAQERDTQVILVSHHPEAINYLASNATVFSRQNGGPVRVRPLASLEIPAVTVAEAVARGWIDA